ncbi:MAG: hypothetical protein GXY33_06105 [Phycisphaerae bacterium]|nr:hypothetical protein [Phycisphaerae bacterium]
MNRPPARSASRFLPTLVAVLTWAALAPVSASAEEVTADIDVSVQPCESAARYHGYEEIRLAVRNVSPDRTHRVRLQFPATSYGSGGHHLSSAQRTVVVGPESEAAVSIFLPPLPYHGFDLKVFVDGRPSKKMISVRASDFDQNVLMSQHHLRYAGSGFVTRNVPVLASRSISGEFTTHVQPEPSSPAATSGPGGGVWHGPSTAPTYQVVRSEMPVANWSGEWLGYTRYDGVVVSGSDWSAAGPETRAALTAYVESGGSLLVIGPWQPPQTWRRHMVEDDPVRYRPGFGECTHIVQTDPGAWSEDTWKQVRQGWHHTGEPWLANPPVSEANRMFPVVSGLSTPVRGLFLLMLTFAVVIGPVNLWVLSRRKKRIWMLWTVPAISLLTCAAVFGYSVLAEGFAGHARAMTLTLLDQDAQQATTLGYLALYSPLTPGGGLFFDTRTELTPQVGMNTWNTPGRDCMVDWTTGQHLASGWVVARVPAHFKVRRCEKRRERLGMRFADDGRLIVSNRLGANVVHLIVRGYDGRFYEGSEIRAGAEAALSAVSGAAGGVPFAAPAIQDEIPRFALRTVYRSNVIDEIHQMSAHPRPYLQNGTYLAVLEASAFLEPGLQNAQIEKSEFLVYGLFSEATR